MQNIKFNRLLIITCVLMFGLTSAFAGDNNKKKDVRRPRNTGILTVKTTRVVVDGQDSRVAYPVKIDGQVIGMSGTDAPAEFYLAPGTHRLEIEGPDGKVFSKDIEIRKDVYNCICLKIIEETTKRPCPYDIGVELQERVLEGELLTFRSFNKVSTNPIPVKYAWTVTPSEAVITSGQGTDTITINTRGLGEQVITADLDVNDGVYDATCRQKISVQSAVEKEIKPFDTWQAVTFDDDKARFDAFVERLQSRPNDMGYITIYQGIDKAGSRQKKGALSRRTLNYLVKERGVDPSRFIITDDVGTRPETTFELWVLPPGTPPPVMH